MPVQASPLEAAAAAQKSIEYDGRVTLHSLPPEILGPVLSEAPASSWYNRQYYSSLFNIRSVCKQWMDIVDANPCLWTSIWLASNLELTKLILIRSKTQLLSVWYDDEAYASSTSLPGGHISSFLDLVASSSRRWKFLDYRASCYAQHERMLGLPFNELGQLNILLSGNIAYTSTLTAPRLKSLDVHRCSLNWHSISALRSLAIDQNTEGPNLDELVAVLRASPDLKKLRVERNWPMTATVQPESSPTLPPIFLPKLQVMRFEKLPVVPLSILLDQIEAPNLLRFSHSMTYKGTSDDFPLIFGAAGRHIGGETQFRRDGNPFQLTVIITYDTLAVRVGDREIELRRFRWTEGDHQEKFASLSAALARFHPNLCSAITILSLEGSPRAEEVAEYLRLIHEHCPQLKELIISGFRDDDAYVVAIVEALSWEQDVNNRYEVLFPRMKTLRVLGTPYGSMPSGDPILQLARRRADSTQAETLRVLGLEGFRVTQETMEELKPFLPDLQWTRTEIVDDMVHNEPSS